MRLFPPVSASPPRTIRVDFRLAALQKQLLQLLSLVIPFDEGGDQLCHLLLKATNLLGDIVAV